VLNKSSILLVDDNEFNTMLAVDTLKSVAPHMHIAEAESGYQALELLKNYSFDIVLMDIQMPQLSGTETTKIIRTELEPSIRNIKIIAMTANVMKSDIQLYLAAGMNDHIPKPFQKEELIRKLLLHLNHDTISTRTLEYLEPIVDTSHHTSEIVIEKPVHSGKITDPRFLISFAGNDKEKQKKYVSIFLQNAPKQIQQLQNGLDKHDYEMIKIAAHSLKTQLNYMGVKEELSHVFELEQMASHTHKHQEIEELIINLKNVAARAFEELEDYIQ